MSWVCPACKRQREITDAGCPCGFAPHKILGISASASEDELRSAYHYLQSVWDPSSFSHDLTARRRAEARMSQINAAYRVFAARFPKKNREASRPVQPVAIAIAGATVMIVVVIAMFALRSSSRPDNAALPTAAPVDAQPAQVMAGPAAQAPAQATTQAQAPSPVPPAGEMNEQQAIETVKNSKTLDRIFSADAIVKKWSEENAARFKVIGWNARRADDSSYLVSYTVLDGAVTRGFYFDVNIQTGEVQNVANSPDLQKKHKISFGAQP